MNYGHSSPAHTTTVIAKTTIWGLTECMIHGHELLDTPRQIQRLMLSVGCEGGAGVAQDYEIHRLYYILCHQEALSLLKNTE